MPRKASVSPTQRTLALLRAEGWTAQVVERWIPRAFIRKDLYGCIDILAINGKAILGVQATSGSNISARLAKIASLPSAALWRASGGLLEVHGWRKVGARGKRKVWEVRRIAL